jgi:hypothetical protein
MSAVISVVQNAGQAYAGASQEIAKNISYFLTQDNAVASKSTYPLAIPSAGVSYSYEVWVRCRCDLAPNSHVDAIKAWYDSGMPATGYKITVNSDAVSSYQAPSNLISNRGTRVDFTTKNSEEDSIDLSGTLEDVGDYSSWLIFQLEIYPTAETGSFGIDYIIQYDEY